MEKVYLTSSLFILLSGMTFESGVATNGSRNVALTCVPGVATLSSKHSAVFTVYAGLWGGGCRCILLWTLPPVVCAVTIRSCTCIVWRTRSLVAEAVSSPLAAFLGSRIRSWYFVVLSQGGCHWRVCGLRHPVLYHSRRRGPKVMSLCSPPPPGEACPRRHK
jgi:hypothetical protein